MSQPSLGIGYVCRSCRRAAKSLASTSTSSNPARTFSRTSRQDKNLATFKQTSSAELDVLFATWRNNVFLPSVLPPHHQKLMRSEKGHEILNTPPGVSVTVTQAPALNSNIKSGLEETIKLHALEKHSTPSKTDAIKQLIEAFEDKELRADDAIWDNLVPFLEGLKTARISISAADLAKLVRKAQQANKEGVMVQAATKAQATGLSLAYTAVAREFLLGIHQRLLKQEFRAFKIKSEKDRLTKLTQIMQQKAHQPQKDNKDMQNMLEDPLMMGIALELAAADAIKSNKAIDQDTQVARAVSQLLVLDGKTSGGIIQACKRNLLKGEKANAHPDMEDLTTIHNAVTLASRIDLKPGLGQERALRTQSAIQTLLGKLENEIKGLEKHVGSQARCSQMHYSARRIRNEMQQVPSTRIR